MPMSRRAAAVLVVALIPALIGACARQPVPVADVPRQVKVEVIADNAPNTSGGFVGTVRARRRAELGFESSGRIAEIRVDVGDQVRAGQVLASLEGGPARSRLHKAEADRAAAAAVLGERSIALDQQRSLATAKLVA